jgi:hypothetical protein
MPFNSTHQSYKSRTTLELGSANSVVNEHVLIGHRPSFLLGVCLRVLDLASDTPGVFADAVLVR